MFWACRNRSPARSLRVETHSLIVLYFRGSLLEKKATRMQWSSQLLNSMASLNTRMFINVLLCLELSLIIVFLLALQSERLYLEASRGRSMLRQV